jgi:enediyne biosynthesis protein E8
MRGANMSETHRMIEREDERLARSTGISVPVRLTRRALLTRTAALAAAWTVCPWPIGVPSAFGQGMDRPSMTQTLEAFADTLIPGEKRFPADRAIAGVVSGAGAVQAGAIEMLDFVGFTLEQLAFLAFLLNVHAFAYAAGHGIGLTLKVPPFVELDFASRTALLVEILDGNGLDQGVFYGLASVCFVAYHTAGNLPTAEAIRKGHPGLAAIGFPPPDPDGIWRFPEFSYRRVLAVPHPDSRRGNPA